MCVDRFTIPLLRDHHSHPFIYTGLMEGVKLSEAATREEAILGIRTAAEKSGSGWTLAYGWHNGRYSLSPDDLGDLPPIVVLDVSLHGLLLNRAGREAMAATDPEVIAHLDDQAWVERHMLRILTGFARLGATVDRLQRFFRHLLEEHGVYFVEEMLLAGEDELRLFGEAGLLERTRFWASPDVYDRLSEEARSKVHGIKLFADGAIGTRSAALHDPYRDTGGIGLLLYERDELSGLIERYLDAGLAVAIHAIGDRAIDQVIEAVAELKPPPGRVRIEHAQLISRQAAERAKASGIHLCMQPNFSDDTLHFASALRVDYRRRNNPFRMLIDEAGFVPGEDLFFGSDGMPHGVVEALRQSIFPPLASQVLTLDEFVAGYCLDRSDLGSIEVEVDRENRRVRSRVELSSTRL